MATTIKLKNGSGAPDAADLVQGEVALDLTNKRIYSENASGTVIEMGTSPSTIDINAGTIDGTVIGGASAAAITGTTITGTSFVTSGDMTFGDNDKAIFGAGSDLQIYHDGSNSYVDEQGTGNLIIRGTQMQLKASDGTSYAEFNDSGAVNLRYSGDLKLATTATGIDVTGTVTADGLTVDAGASDIAIVFDDNSVTNRYQFTTGGNSLDSFFKINSDATRAAHLQTLSGSVSFDIASGFGRNDINFSGADLFIKRGGTKALEIDQATGDISFYEDTGTTPKLFWDASAESLGIKTTSPAATFDVNGAFKINGGAGLTLATLDSTWARMYFGISGGANTYFDCDTFIFRSSPSSGASERMRIDSSGHLIVPNGVTLGTAAGTYSAANTLDDYEEGTFTPELADASTGGNAASIGSDLGYYTKIGNLVYITVICTDIDTTGMTAGNTLYFRGLPFSAVNQGELTVRFDRITFSGKFVTVSHSTGTTARFFETVSNAQDAALTVAAIDGTASDLFISGCFRV